MDAIDITLPNEEQIRAESKAHSFALLGSKTQFVDHTVIHVDFKLRKKVESADPVDGWSGLENVR